MESAARPVRVAVVNDYAVVVAGVAAVLAPYSDRVAVVELDSRMPTVSDVDVVLYDTFGQVQGDSVDLEELLQGGTAKVVLFSWNLHPELVRAARERGASGYLSKGLSGEQMASLVERVAAGQTVWPDQQDVSDSEAGTWPGRDHGLTAREAEVVALITQGLSNQEIAERTYLSINSVKTYIRTAYRKMGVSRRSQAVVWGYEHGFRPDRLRIIDEHAQSDA